MGAEVDGRAKLLGRGGLLHWQAMVCEIVPPAPSSFPGNHFGQQWGAAMAGEEKPG